MPEVTSDADGGAAASGEPTDGGEKVWRAEAHPANPKVKPLPLLFRWTGQRRRGLMIINHAGRTEDN